MLNDHTGGKYGFISIYKKDTTSTHLDVHSDSFARENAQLIEQEFEPIGDIIEA